MPYVEPHTLRARVVSAARISTVLVVMLSMSACGETKRTDALPMVGPLTSFSGNPLGVPVADLMRERSAIMRAPLGGLREAAGDWVLHYDVPPPASEELFPTMRVSGVTAMRALPDSLAATRLRDSLLAEIGPANTERCVTVRRGKQRAPATIVRRGDYEYMIGYWSRDLPTASVSAPDSIPLPILFAVTYRPAADARPNEDVSPCGTTAPTSAK